MRKDKKLAQAEDAPQVEDVPVEVIEVTDEEQAAADEDVVEACEDAQVAAEIKDEAGQCMAEPEPVRDVEQAVPAAGDVVDPVEEPCCDVDINDESTLSIDGGVVEKIVAMTCREVPGVLQLKGNLINSLPGLRGSDVTKGVSVEMSGDDACTVNVAVILEYGTSAPRVFQELHDKVTGAIETMTGLKVNAVNVRVTNVLTRAEVEGGKRREKGDA